MIDPTASREMVKARLADGSPTLFSRAGQGRLPTPEVPDTMKSA